LRRQCCASVASIGCLLACGLAGIFLFPAPLLLPFFLLVLQNVCHVTYCGVFGRWYFQVDKGSALTRSWCAATTTSFGSVCFGASVVPAARIVRIVAEIASANAQEAENSDENAVCCILCAILCAITACMAQGFDKLLKYSSGWAFVQCAVRGVSFVEGMRITFSMMSASRVGCVAGDLMIDSVVCIGMSLCSLAGLAAGAGAAFATSGAGGVAEGAVIGALAGLAACSPILGVLTSGTRTVLALWAEDPEPLRAARPEMHAEFDACLGWGVEA